MGREVRPDPALVRLMMGFYNAVLSMQLRRWLSEPDEPGADRPRRERPMREPDDEPPFGWDDGGAGARVPRRPLIGPFHPPAAVQLEEPDWLDDLEDLGLGSQVVHVPLSTDVDQLRPY
jgi:hypothetical protein